MRTIALSTSEYFCIKGGIPLRGEVEVSGSKNASLPILIASLLSKDESTIINAPDLLDVQNTVELLENLGAEVVQEGNTIRVYAKEIANCKASDETVRKMRASVLVMGPLLVRCNHAIVSMPGGCSIGVRPVDQHLKFFSKAGVDVEIRHGYIHLKVKHPQPTDFAFDLITVTGTENALMFLSSIEGKSILRNIAIEPEVMDLVRVLNQMGAEIEVEGRTAIIRGTRDLKGFTHRVIPDRIEAGTLMVSAFATGGDVIVKNIKPDHLNSVTEALKEAGAKIEKLNNCTLRVYSGNKRINPLKIETKEYPGFPTDMQAQFMALLSIAKGSSLIKENIFENRFQHVMEMRRMGAEIEVRGNTAFIKGVNSLTGAEVFSTDLRASASLVIAGLIAEGETIVRDIYHLDRGYEKLDKKLKELGAEIERIDPS